MKFAMVIVAIALGLAVPVMAQVAEPVSPPPVVQSAPAATQNTVTTTGPVSSETTISVGTLAGQALEWTITAFGVPIGTLLSAWLYRLFRQAGVNLSDSMRARLQEIIINGLAIGAKKASENLAGRGQVEIKNAALVNAVKYVQDHGADTIKELGFDPNSNIAVEAIKARMETAITDVNTPTPAVLGGPPQPVAAPAA